MIGDDQKTLSREVVGEFLRSVGTAEAHVFPATGVGQDVRLAGNGVTGGALVAEDRVLHLSAFVRACDRDHQ